MNNCDLVKHSPLLKVGSIGPQHAGDLPRPDTYYPPAAAVPTGNVFLVVVLAGQPKVLRSDDLQEDRIWKELNKRHAPTSPSSLNLDMNDVRMDRIVYRPSSSVVMLRVMS